MAENYGGFHTQGGDRLELVPLSDDSLGHSQDEYVVTENEPNNHLYSLGKFVHCGPHRRCQLLESDLSSSPSTSSTLLPPRRTTAPSCSANTVVKGTVDVGTGSGSGSDVTSSMHVESTSKVVQPEGTSKRGDTLPPRIRGSTAAVAAPAQLARSKTKLVSFFSSSGLVYILSVQ